MVHSQHSILLTGKKERLANPGEVQWKKNLCERPHGIKANWGELGLKGKEANGNEQEWIKSSGGRWTGVEGEGSKWEWTGVDKKQWRQVNRGCCRRIKANRHKLGSKKIEPSGNEEGEGRQMGVNRSWRRGMKANGGEQGFLKGTDDKWRSIGVVEGARTNGGEYKWVMSAKGSEC